MNKKQLFLLSLFLLVLACFFIFDLGAYLQLSFFQAQRELLLGYKENNFALLSLLYFLLYILVTAFSLPAAALVTLAGGALFGFWWALFLVSFASSIGASLAFLMARTVLRDWVQNKFGHKLKPINEGIEKAKVGLFILTNNFFDSSSGWPLTEFSTFFMDLMKNNKKVLMVNAGVDEDKMHSMMKSFRYLNWNNGDGLPEIANAIQRKLNA